MIYKFKSKAAGDLIMLQPAGDQVMRLIGKEPAAQGIIEPAAMPAAMAALQQAVVDEEAARAEADKAAADAGHKPAPRDSVSLRQRVWPLIDMMKRAHAAGAEIVWGV